MTRQDWPEPHGLMDGECTFSDVFGIHDSSEESQQMNSGHE